MKKLFVIFSIIINVNAFADTILFCNDQNSHAVYQLELNANNTRMQMSPILKDSSTLSKSIVNLRYNEGESGDTVTMFEGKNLNSDVIVIELNLKQLENSQLAEVEIFFTKNSSKILDQKTTFLCEIKK